MDRTDVALLARNRDRAAFYRHFYEPLAANILHGIAVIDASCCVVLYANTRFLANHGVAQGAKLPLHCSTVYGAGGQPCLGEETQCPAMRVCREGTTRRHQETLPAREQRPPRTLEILTVPLTTRTEFGQGSEVLIIEKDGQPLLRPRGATEEEREHLAAIIRHSADAIIGLDLDRKIRSWNQGAVETFGYTPEETIGRDFRFLVPADRDSQREYEAELRDFERRDILRNYQARRVAKDGRTVVVTCTRSLVRGPDGGPRGVSVICRDVTMEVLLKELIDHQIRAMSVTHEIGDVLHSTRSVDEILQVILLGVTAGQGLGFNRAFLLLVEQTEDGGPERLRGKMAIGPSNAEEAGRIWASLSKQRVNLVELYQRYREESARQDVLVNSIVAQIDVPLSREDHVLVRALRSREALNVLQGRIIGDDLEVDRGLRELLQCDSFAVVPLNTRDSALGVLVVDNRITGIGISDADLQMLKVFANHAGIALENSQLRQHLERRLEELAQLNLAMKENQAKLIKSERLSIIGEMAARVVHEVRNPLVAIGGFARLVRRGLNAEDPRSDYLRIISDEVSRLERIVQGLLDFSRPKSALNLREVALNEQIREIVAMATVEAEAHGVTVKEAYDRKVGKVVLDIDKVRQVLLNIIRNALDVMLEKGTLRIETAALPPAAVRITIQDTGPGIPAELRPKVFEPGFTTRQEGTGFGLAIAKRLVELQGGQITLRDSGPPGCTFDIVLPQRVATRAEAEDRKP
ncbi:MAG: PAS domain S-box protein [Planctomycetes bacterium]|nr:PAS domain S-box protein [Planctomycetota bacterium]